MTHPNRPYNTIDEETAREIKELHKRHPKLGHHGLLEALKQDGILVDSEELERFMRVNRIKAERFWRPLRWLGAPSWLGGSTDAAHAQLHIPNGGEDDSD